jgi:nucleoside-diphosphate-sugar epimerase
MKILLAGASGAPGRVLIPALVARGPEVVGEDEESDEAGSIESLACNTPSWRQGFAEGLG